MALTTPNGSTVDEQGNIITQGTSPVPNTPTVLPQDTSSNNTPPSDQSPQSPQAPQAPQGATDVGKLQDYLVQMGYISPDQIGAGKGTYGPKTTAAVAKLQKDLGISPSGKYDQSTQAAIQSKYATSFNSLKGTQAPQNYPGSLQGALQTPTSDSPIGAVMNSMQPILQSLSQVMQNINNPALTATSLQQEYNDLAQKNNLPGMNSQLLNMQNIMNGTTDDIRNEITSAGGSATESQIMALSASRNNVILKQYNALATQYQAAQTNIQNMMQFSSQDQQTQMQRQNMSASVAESIAGIEQQMVTMGMTMQQNTSTNLNKIVTNIGYTGLASEAKDNPQLLGYYENTLGLAQGSLSDTATLKDLETYRQQQLALGQQRVTIQMYNAGMGVGGTQTPITPNPGGGSSITKPFTSTDLKAPSWMPKGINPLYSSDQMQQLAGIKAINQDPGTDNYVMPGIGYYVKQSDGSYALNSAIPQATAQNSIQSQYNDMTSSVKQAQAKPVGGSPLNKGRLSRNANTALKSYLDSPVYQNVSNGAVYLSRISAARNNPGSVSDLELADSIVKISNGGSQVTEAQLGTYFQGQSYSDMFAVQGDKLTQKGGVLSPQQRVDLQSLADETFDNYQQQYEQLYVQAGENLKGQGIPLNYLANMPDWTSFLTSDSSSVPTDQ